MRFVQRGAWALILLACLTSPVALFAQDGDLSVAGSGIANPLFTALADEAGLSYSINTTGTDNGLDQFCSGQVAIATATRAITVEEESVCDQNEIAFSEVLLGYEVLAFIVNPERTDAAACLSAADLNTLLSPTAIETATWQAFTGEEEPAVEVDLGDAAATEEVEVAPVGDSINAYLPPSNTSTYAFLDQIVTGIGFRADAATVDAEEAVIAAVAEDSGAIGVVRLSLLPDGEADGTVTIELQNPQTGQCVAPSAESASNLAYIASQPIYAYIAASALEDANVTTFLDAVVSPESATSVAAAGFTPPTDVDYEISQEAISETGRQFSRALTEYQIPPTVAGTVTVEGGPAGFNLISSAVAGFTQQFQNVTITPNLEGIPVGLRRLCNGEIDVAVTYEPLSQETLDNCEAIDIKVLEVEIGPQVAILVANEADDYLTCLTTDEIASVWGANAAEPATNWQSINDSYPDQEFILFASNSLGDPIPNFMLAQIAGQSIPLREDVETDRDPLYRAAAVANVPGSLTYMTWSDYQDVLENEQARIQLVAVDAGDGCVTPTEETITSGEYPLTRTLRLAISRRALERVEVQSFLWFLFGDDRFRQFENNNFDLLTLRDLADIRDTLQTAYDEADTAAAERAAAAVTEEAPSPDATDEPAAAEETEAPVEATEAAAEPEVEATEEAAEADATEEAEVSTAEPTEEATPEAAVATEESTEETEVEATEAVTAEAEEVVATDEPTIATDEAAAETEVTEDSNEATAETEAAEDSDEATDEPDAASDEAAVTDAPEPDATDEADSE